MVSMLLTTQYTDAMNTVRSCFAVSALLLLFTVDGPHSIVFATAVEWLDDERTTCCTTPGDIGVDPGCQYGNQTFHKIEIIGGSGLESCPKSNGSDTNALQLVRKCCPPNQIYDPETLSCQAGNKGQNSTDFLRQMMEMLKLPDRMQDTVTVVGYNYGPAMCQEDEVLIDDKEPTANGPLLSEDHNCFDVTPKLQLVARNCRQKFRYCGEGNGRYTCVNKCCKGDKMHGKEQSSWCDLISKKPLNLNIYENTNDGNLSNKTLLLPYHKELSCNDYAQYENDEFTLLVNGQLKLDKTVLNLAEDKYCLEYMSEDDGKSTKVIALMCPPEGATSDNRNAWGNLPNVLGFVLSIVCLSVTLIVYAMLPTLRNVYGYCVMCYVSCLLLSLVCLLISEWWTDVMDDWSLCKLIGYTTLFSFLGIFCWLNVICFDIFWILRYNKPINKTSLITTRIVIYAIYGWGFPITWTCIASIFQHSEHTKLSIFSPDIGITRCWFSGPEVNPDNRSFFIFYLLPLSIMMVANLIMFGLTAVYCLRIKSELNKFRQTDSRTRGIQQNIEKFGMSMKLFLVMGIPWTFEILQSYIRDKDNEHWFITILWCILDVINALQGVMVFVIFVAKRKIIKKLRKKIKGPVDHSESTTMNTMSGSSQSNTHHISVNDF